MAGTIKADTFKFRSGLEYRMFSAYSRFDMESSNTVRKSFNVTSHTDYATGSWRCTWTNAFSGGDDYSTMCDVDDNGASTSIYAGTPREGQMTTVDCEYESTRANSTQNRTADDSGHSCQTSVGDLA